VDIQAACRSTAPKITPRTPGEILAAANAPQTAPTVVAISRNMPMRMLEKPSRTYAAAAPEDVAITEINAAPMA
jgi:hypothetical protein